ncbi:hypothetical protein BCL93_104103 [Onishia taeanensis]|uniref:Uncharacterized protein n=1 Tax=Onishia taeanensis TaxID=284577 RepID=A0A328XQI3_9GAMM|nr:hypothetical protein BCL93_104103 [Halomonas taeanensis]
MMMAHWMLWLFANDFAMRFGYVSDCHRLCNSTCVVLVEN